MQHIPNISTYYILSNENKVFCICDTDDYGSVSQLLYRFSTLGSVSQPLQNSSVVFVFVHVYRQNIKHMLESTFLSAFENFKSKQMFWSS